ncbi:hypothetical protein BXZ70DRAFT_1011851 [Cristinia sonorae]|uniref:Uncharacterized protein n=1 Tax=Cristinia sonorae TaxID=1940300 RepID=A0A8K0UGI7_9AGAR|nr:hypothetical protein BXZ70DRAFT_1011851 [Cristinia sonorae]
MGRSAKFMKKVKKPTTNPSQTKPPISAPSDQKKKASLKAKTKLRKPGSEGHVLGGADYVELMMGGRRKAREEAAKLPRDEDDVDMRG